ncbi:MAG TPA: TolC family protein [Steroidobacteraceae bacterium]|jgi:NodT family efflux transporter outer membrane factor (OMF) lipoprotein|nr:TolC family protein [Steroidobacteraceae bacterium]
MVAACAALLAGCATRVPQLLNPQIVPKSFVGANADREPVWPRTDWWQTFANPELSGFIDAAQTGNRDLAVAATRVIEARAQTTIQRAALFPQLNLQAQGQRSGANSSQLNNFTNSVSGNSFGLTLGASYEVDVWGLARSTLRAATETLKSARFSRQAVALTVTADVANAYFNVLALRKRIAIANEDIIAINGILQTIQLRVSTGTSSHLDLAQERAQVESVEAELPELEEQELEARTALAVLLGEPLQTLQVRASTLEAIRLPLVSPGLPSELLLRRPDVAQAESDLASAHASVDAARAAFLPQFALSGSDGFASAAIGALLHGPSVAWDYGGSLLQSVFDGGKLVGQKKLAEGTQQELIASYQRAVLNAYADVETALGQVKHFDLAEQHLGREVDAARESFQISQLQYRQGTTDLLTVLQSQQTLFSAEDQLAQVTLARMQSVVHLYEALGGGWQEQAADRTQFTSSPVPTSTD